MARLVFRLFALAAATASCLAADRVVYTRIGPTQSTLFIANADGSAERPLTQPGSLNYNPAWSPTGDWIAFTSERGGPANLFRMHPDCFSFNHSSETVVPVDRRVLRLTRSSSMA